MVLFFEVDVFSPSYSPSLLSRFLPLPNSKKKQAWFQGPADAVRQYLWLFEEAVREGVEDYLILSGDHLYRMVRFFVFFNFVDFSFFF